MTEKPIHHALSELRAEIDNLHLDDADTKNHLNQLLQSIEESVASESLENGHTDLIEDMSNAVTQFEVEHPRITGIINDIMVKLSNMGI